MDHTRAAGEGLPQATRVPCPVPTGPAGLRPVTAAVGEAPSVGRGALHGHG
ncbi:hypothetical protein [Streptomyces sp. NPDC054787]